MTSTHETRSKYPGLGIELHFGWGLSYLSPILTDTYPSGQLSMERAIVDAKGVPPPLTKVLSPLTTALSSSNRPFLATTLSFLSSRAYPDFLLHCSRRRPRMWFSLKRTTRSGLKPQFSTGNPEKPGKAGQTE
jgi:hypothetical protein